jgi:hypothetical protein
MIAHAYYGCRQNFINRHPIIPTEKTVEGGRKTTRKPKPYQPFLKS